VPTHAQAIGRYGALRSWANTADRTARTRPARSNSPGSIEYHLARLDPERFGDASLEQRYAAAEAAKKAYFAELTMKSIAARRGGGDDRAA
jgi:hypothetical protein